jgi:hypothetical protein
MKQHGMSLCALASLVALALPCMAQDKPNPWNGSWNMDKSSLKYNGPTTTIATDADGYTVTRDGKARPKVVCDGKPNAPVDGTTTTCTKDGTGYDLENSRDGKTVSKVKVAVSADGKTTTRTAEVIPSDGSSPFTITTTSKRIAGSGTGAAGTWKETGFNESQDTGVLSIKVNGDSVDFKETDNDKPVTVKLDGTPTDVGGGRTMSAKMDGPRTLKVTYSGNGGTMQRENTFVLSANGKTIKETDVTPAPMASTMSVMFKKS